MAKKVDALIKLQVPAGGANPSPPVEISWNSVKRLTRQPVKWKKACLFLL